MRGQKNAELSKRLGERIKQLRESHDITTRDFADLANISHSYRHEIETGNANPSIGQLDAISKVFNLTISELLDGL